MTIETMFQSADRVVQHFKSDLALDRRDIAENPTIPFIHISRESGSHLVTLTPAEDSEWSAIDKWAVSVFNDEGRGCVLRDKRATVEYNIRQSNRLWHHFDGNTVTEIDAAKALAIVHQYIQAVETAWETTTQGATL